MACGNDVAKRCWQTGAALPADMLSSLAKDLSRPGCAPPKIAEDDWVVVVSQTCDIVVDKLEAEPFVEVLHGHRRSGKPRAEFSNLRSTRQIDFHPNPQKHPDVVLTAHAVADRYIVPREWFAQHDPDPTRCLSAAAASRILAWYALRAERPSWPDTLVRRLRGAVPELLASLKPVSDSIAEVRVAIDERDELDATRPYHVAVFFVVDEQVWKDDESQRIAIYTAHGQFAAALARCTGIEVNMDRSDVVPGAEFTWQATRVTDMWNFANLSQRDS